MSEDADLRVRFSRAIRGSLESAIEAHGPITHEWVGSATKRVLGVILPVLVAEVEISRAVHTLREHRNRLDAALRLLESPGSSTEEQARPTGTVAGSSPARGASDDAAKWNPPVVGTVTFDSAKAKAEEGR